MRTIEWVPELQVVRLIDQRKLPNRLEYLYIHTADEMADAISVMAIRGAPALGVAGAFGIALEARNQRESKSPELRIALQKAAEKLQATRPTAVNLAWGVKRLLHLVQDNLLSDSDLAEKLLAEAQTMAEEDIETNLRMAKYGASLINDGDTILHHCNTGSLAAVDWGTALGVIRYAHEQGKKIHVLVDETRPRLQGARLTAWECQQYGIPFEVITDNAAGYFLRHGDVQKVMYGADRVAANGDVVNKIGTYMLSLAAHANNVPVYPVFPLSTLDRSIASGDLVPIEERPAEEVSAIVINGEEAYPKGCRVKNPAFDVTPFELITALITDMGIINPPFSQNIAQSIYNISSNR